MINYKETFEQYKKQFDANCKKFILYHAGINLTATDFIKREQKEWQDINTIMIYKDSEFALSEASLIKKEKDLDKAISEMDLDGVELIKYKCDAILKFLDSKLKSIENSNNTNNHDNLILNISTENLIKLKKIENRFDKTPIEKIYMHYHTSLVEKKHLTENDLIRYLDLAFDKKTPPERLFILSNVKAKKMKIQSYFYLHYTEIAGAPNGKQLKYASLLADYFEGFASKSLSTNFNK